MIQIKKNTLLVCEQNDLRSNLLLESTYDQYEITVGHCDNLRCTVGFILSRKTE